MNCRYLIPLPFSAFDPVFDETDGEMTEIMCENSSGSKSTEISAGLYQSLGIGS